jgi:hypothetical protein
MTQLFALVPIPAPKDVPDNAVMWGTLEECLTGLSGTPSNQELLDIQAAIPSMVEQLQQYEKDKSTFYGTVSDAASRLSDRMDSFEKQRAISEKRAHAEQQRRDRQRVAAYLDTLPDPDRPDNGELTIKHKLDPSAHGYTFDPDDPETWPEEDDAGLDGSIITRPANSPAQLAYPPDRNTRQVQQPISVSLNEE